MSVSVSPTSSAEPGSPLNSSPRSTALTIALIGAANFGVLMAVTTPQFLSLAIKLATIAPEQATTQISYLLTVGVLLQVLMLLLVGRLSDYTTSQLGMRRPWLIAGVLAVTLGCILLGMSATLPMLWAGYMILSVGATTCVACIYASVADQVPEKNRGTATGIIGATSVLGTIVGLFIVQLAPANNFLIFVLPAILAFVLVGLFIVLMKDRVLTESRPITMSVITGAFQLNWRTSPNLAWFVPSIVLVNTALAAVVSYAYYYLSTDIGVAEADLPFVTFMLQLVLNGVTFVVNLFIGPLTDRLRRRKPFYVAAIVSFVLGMGVVLVADGVSVVLLGVGIIGVGQGLVMATYLSIAIDAMEDDSTSARDINVVAACYTLPYAYLPFLAPVLLGPEGTNFTALFIAAGVLTLAAALVLPKVGVR